MPELEADHSPRRSRRFLASLVIPLAAVLFIVGVMAGIAWVAMSLMRKTDVYQLAWEKVRNDPQVIATLGEPITEGWLASGELHTSDGSGSAEIAFDIAGPNGSASVSVSGTRAEGVWSLAAVKVLLNGKPDPLVLVAPTITPEAAPAGLPPGRQPEDTVWNARLANIPAKPLTHASRELELRGRSRDYVRSIFGEPTEIRTASFEKLRYGQPDQLPYYDEQWIYRRNMGHLLVFFQNDLTVLSVEEWSDF